MHEIDFIHDLAIIMLVAGVVTVVFHLLKQPVVLGYIVAGIVIGPHTPPFPLVTNQQTIQTLAELGVVFLLFSLGLEFSLQKLRKVGATAVVAALAGMVLMLWVGYEIGRSFSWRNLDAIFLGAMLAISSTTITIKALDDLKLKKEKFAQLVFGILIVEDILAIAMIALLSSMAVTGTVDTKQVLVTLGELMVFLVTSLVIGLLTVPRLLNFVARFNSNEMLLVSVLGVCFGFCLLVVQFGYSVALGAFVIGAIVAESRALKRIEHVIEPVRDMFSAIFFVAIGMLLNPLVLVDYAWPIVVITLAVLFGKVVSRSLGAFVAGQSGHRSLQVGMSLAQIGEFSFIIATLGTRLKVTSDFLYPIAVAVSAITTLLTPYLIRYAQPLATLLGRNLPKRMTGIFNAYTDWLQSLRFEGDRAVIVALVRKILLQVFVNLCLVIAIFISGAYLANSNTLRAWLPDPNLEKTFVWGAAFIASMPFLIATYRKLKALSMMLAEISVRDSTSSWNTERVRRVIAEIIPAVSIAAMLLLLSALSSSILPPIELLVAIFVMSALLLALLWRWLVRLHARLQIALLDTLQSEKDSH